MDLSKYPYRATFASVAKVVSPGSEDRFIAKAALAPLKGLLPEGIDPQNDSDMLYIACNGAVAALVNRNGDCISAETALAINDSAKFKYISTDHDRTKVVGMILEPGFSTYGTNEPLTREAAAALKEPFNMAFVGALWRVINPMLSKFLSNVGDDVGQDALSMSWEIAFDGYSLMVGSENTFDAQIIAPSDARFESFDKLLRANGGEGKDASGRLVSRLITGDPVILGYSVVANPAAHVKGILPLERAAEPVAAMPAEALTFLENEPEAGAGYHLCDVTMKSGQVYSNVALIDRRILPAQIDPAQVVSVTPRKKNDEKNITHEKASVTLTTQAMKISIASVEELKSKWDELKSLPAAEALASVESFVEVIKKSSEQYVKDLEARENLVKDVEEAQAAAIKRAEKLETEMAALAQKLADVEARAEASEAASKFSERMASFDSEFDLDDEDRTFIAKDIKDLDDDAFAAYSSKCKKLMAGKKKGAKPFPPKDDKKDDEAPAKSKADDDGDDDADASAKAAQAKEALASVVEIKDQAKLPNVHTVVDATLKDQMGAAFGATFKIDGKTVAERNSKKNQKQA